MDRAALDFALAHDIPYGGWCPRGGWAEDHPLPPGLLASYPELRETPSAEPAQRTRWNVRDSDATLVIVVAGAGPAGGLGTNGTSPGTALTEATAAELGRPLLRVDALDPEAAQAELMRLLGDLPTPFVLNVAGPRASEAPDAYAQGISVLEQLLS